MDVGEVDMNERISMTRTEYSVLKEVLKYHECGWSKGVFGRAPRSSRSTKQLHSIFFLPNTPAPKTPDPPNPWI
jgi:hypothetical protein